ncbi:hypothetical protein Tco_0077749 [Tanacetum coccineum]
MQGTSLTKQERECKLYDEFDKFTYKKGESLHEYYLRFTLLLNDLNIYKMPLEQFQVSTKFLNTLPAEWSKFITDVKLVKDLHTTNVDQIYAHLEQHERHANEVRLMHERNSDPLALYGSPYQSQQCSTHQSSTPLSITYPSNEYQQSIHHNVYSPSTSIPQLEYAPSVNQQSEFSQPDSGLIVPVFQKGDDLIDTINHMMSFLTAVVTSCYPTTNNELRNLLNPRQQATINDGRVTVQLVQGRQISYAVGTIRTFTLGASRSNYGKQRTVISYNSQANGQILHEEELAFLADPGIAEDALAEVHNHDNVNNNMINQAVQAMQSSEQSNVVNHSETEITSDSNIIPYSHVNDTLTAELERYKEQVKVLKEGQNVDLRSNDNVSDSSA